MGKTRNFVDQWRTVARDNGKAKIHGRNEIVLIGRDKSRVIHERVPTRAAGEQDRAGSNIEIFDGTFDVKLFSSYRSYGRPGAGYRRRARLCLAVAAAISRTVSAAAATAIFADRFHGVSRRIHNS